MTGRYRVALLGHGIGASLSPALHTAEARRLGLDYEYRIVDLLDRPGADVGTELLRLEEAGFDAANITHPFKQSVLEHVTHVSTAVRRIGSANLVLLAGRRGSARTAHNTDGTGFRAALEGFLAGRGASAAGTATAGAPAARTSAATGTVLQIGAGGAGLATASALIDLRLDRLVVHDVVPEAVTALLARFSGPSGGATRLQGADGVPDAWLPRVDGVVHVTPLGMAEHPGVAFDVDRLRPDAWVAEVVYRPLETELVRRARARGLATLDGGAMAVGQAAESLRLITGLPPDTRRMQAHFDRLVTGATTS